MSSIVHSVQEFIARVPRVQRVWVACSGGVDSTVLLHAVAKAGLTCPVAAIYVNHQLSPNADAWQEQVRQLCLELGVTFYAERVEVADRGSLEQAARQARYQAFDRHLQVGDLLLTAHHQQDQAETFFLRLLRGAGLRGLSAMKPLRTLGQAQLGRPLLNHCKEELLTYARNHALQWVEDESNQRQIYDRNFLRAEVMPLLERRWPQYLHQITATTQLLQEAETLLGEYAAQDLALCEPQAERLGQSLLLAPLLVWNAPRRNQVLRSWLDTLGYRMPEQKQFAELERFLVAQEDKCPVLLWQDCEIRRYLQRIYCLPRAWQQSVRFCSSTIGSSDNGVAVGLGELRMQPALMGLRVGREYIVKLRSACPDIQRAHPSSRGHSQILKKLLQEYQLEPWLRPWVPLVVAVREADEELVAVADLWIEKNHLAHGDNTFGLVWRINPDGGNL